MTKLLSKILALFLLGGALAGFYLNNESKTEEKVQEVIVIEEVIETPKEERENDIVESIVLIDESENIQIIEEESRVEKKEEAIKEEAIKVVAQKKIEEPLKIENKTDLNMKYEIVQKDTRTNSIIIAVVPEGE